MSDTAESQNPMEFFKSLWGNMGVPLPGMVTPTVDTDELGRRITDLKAVEGWLKSNLSMLQMTIQGLEMQRATLMAIQGMAQQAAGAPEGQPAGNAFWPWNFVPPEAKSTEAPAGDAKPARTAPEPPSTRKRKPKR